MSLISRLTTWVASQVLTSAALNAEFSNVTNTLNNLDATTTSWTGVKAGTLQATTSTTTVALTSTGVTILKGSITNDSAAAGNVGEYVEADASATNFPASGAFGDLTSISLTAGDWDVSVVGVISNSNATFTSGVMGASVNTGNNSAGLTNATTACEVDGLLSGTVLFPLSVPNIRFSLSGSSSVFLKYEAAYTGGPPKLAGRISARRVR